MIDSLRFLTSHLLGPRPPHVLYLAHIPKTCGTTADAMIRSRVGPFRSSPKAGPIEMLRLPPGRLDSFDFISGHLEFGHYLGALVSRPVRVITFLREPRSLLLSIYKQMRKDPTDPLRSQADVAHLEIEEFYNHPVASAYVENFQTRYLALAEGRLDPRAIAEIRAARSREAIEQAVLEAHRRQGTPSARDLLARALERLGECWLVGLSHRLDDAMTLLAQRLGWAPFGPAPRLNESPDRCRVQDLPPSVLRRMDELTVLDQALYAEALRRAGKEAPARRAA